MNVTKKEIDNQHLVVIFDFDKSDYEERVNQELKKQKRNAVMPGFRKGHIPMSFIKKQYEKTIIVQEINELLQNGLNDFIKDEKLTLLGDPIPVKQEEWDWETGKFSFGFELGLLPDIPLDLDTKDKVIFYDLYADKPYLDDRIEKIREEYGEWKEVEAVEDLCRITGNVTYEIDEKHENEAVLFIKDIKNKTQKKKLIGKKAGDTVKLKTKGLFKDDHILMHLLHLPHDKVHASDFDFEITIRKIEKNHPAPLDIDLFSRIYHKEEVKDTQTFTQKTKKLLEDQMRDYAKKMFVNEFFTYITENTHFDLPEAYLRKLITHNVEKDGEKIDLDKEYPEVEKGFRYQLIRNKLVKEHNLEPSETEYFNYVKSTLSARFLSYGVSLPDDEEMNKMTLNYISTDEGKEIIEQLLDEKITEFLLENARYKTQKIAYTKFLEQNHSH